MLYKFFAFGCILCAVMSCNTSVNTNVESLIEIPIRDNKDSLTIIEANQMAVPIDCLENKNEFLLRPFVYKDRWMYALERSKPFNRLVRLDLYKREFIKAFDISDPELRQEGITSFYVHSPDSIFVQASNSGVLVLLDSLGKVVKRYDTSPAHNFVAASFLPYQTGMTDSKAQRFFFTMIPVKFFGSSDDTFDSTPFQGVFSLNTEKLSLAYAPLEGIMKVKSSSFYPPDLSVPYNLVIGDYNYVNYPMDHSIFIYDVNSGRLISKKTPAARTQVALSPPLHASLASQKQEIWNFRITTSFYEPLFFHSEAQVFTRIIHLPQPLKLEDQRLNNGENRTSLLLILNRNLECVGEQLFRNGAMPVHSMLALPDGLLIQTHLTKDSIHFQKYTFKTIQ